MDERLRRVRLFADLSDEDLVRICQGVEERRLAAGAVLFEEGDPGDTAYVVTAGDVEVVKTTGGRQTLLALRGPGDVIGEMALLQEEPRIATVRARTPAELLTIPKSVLDAVLATSPAAVRSLLGTLLERLHETNERQRQMDRMVQLGTLTAGVAHELNNPAAAGRRAAERLSEVLERLGEHLATAARALDSETFALVVAAAAAQSGPAGHAVDISDEEEAVEEWLARRGAPDAWRLAGELVESGFTAEQLEGLAGDLPDAAATVAAELLARLTLPRRLTEQIAEGTTRISQIVGSLKSHAYLDRATITDVDVHRGLDDTVLLLAHRLRGVAIARDYGSDVPSISAAGAELNQVWTNLLDNAAYELERAGVDQPKIALRTMVDGDRVTVEIEDNGPGIAPEVRERLFDAFFTTKPPGDGTGQGLNLSYRIVVLDHHGELAVDSEAGRTIFRVVLPIAAPPVTAARAAPSAPPAPPR